MHASTAILWLALVIPATAVALALIVWQTARLIVAVHQSRFTGSY